MARIPAHRRKRDPLRRQIPGVYKPPPCRICGKPVPSGAAQCEQPCQPRVVKAEVSE